jgi:hypothetical protein
MNVRLLLPGALGVAFFVLLEAHAYGQETIFNVPSPDVLEEGHLYLETDQYFRPWKTQSDRDGFFLLRGVYGLGSNVEIGLNSGPFDYVHDGEPFIDLTVKWRPVRSEFEAGDSRGTIGFIVGDNVGVGLEDEVAGRFRNLVYAAGNVETPWTKTRLSAGPYFATRRVFDDRDRFGAQVTFEQPIPGIAGLEFATDWFSGPGASVTSGVIWTIDRFVLYAGYGFANKGRRDDLITLELGVNF